LRQGIALIVVLFAGLYFIPPFLRKSDFSFSGGSSTFSPRVLLDEPLSIATTKGKTTLQQILADHPEGILLNFWATWCAPCLEELPSLENLNRYLRGKKLPVLVTVSEDDSITAIHELFKTLDFTPSFIALHDPDGALLQAIGTDKFPETYWISSKGEILYKWVGPQVWTGQDVLKVFAPRG
jgi:thiol-disulfide isomerase/thioredoxin